MSKDTSHTQPRDHGRFVKKERIDYDAAVKLAAHVIQGREDYVYDEQVGGSCHHWNKDKDQPSCLIGWIVWEWGLPKQEIIDNDYASVFSFERVIDRKAMYFLSELQGRQDNRTPWGEAVATAKDVTEQFWR